MNNKELVNFFQTIDKISNCFDREIALKKATKDYKKSIFYKNTHYSIYKAYALFCLNSFNILSSFFNSDFISQIARGEWEEITATIESLIDDFDPTCLDKIFTFLENKLANMAVENINFGSELDSKIKEFKTLLK